MFEVRGRTLVIFAAAVTAAFFGAAFGFVYDDADGWYEERIDACESSNTDVVVTVDDAGSVHAVYSGISEERTWAVKHAVWDGDGWRTSIMAPSGDRLIGLQVLVDSVSSVHAGWCESETGFRYVSDTAGVIESASVDIDDFYSGGVSIDPSGTVRGFCSIQRWVNTWPDHWEWEFQEWLVSEGEWTKVATYGIKDNTSFPLAGTLLVHGDDKLTLISYRDNLTGSERMAVVHLTESGLEYEDPIPLWGDYSVSDVDLDSQGRIHMAIRYDEYTPRLGHMFHDGTEWVTEFVDYAGESPWNLPRMFIDEQDGVYLTYLREYYSLFDVSELVVAKRTDSGWLMSSLDTPGALGWDRPALAVDAQGVYHVAHFAFDGAHSNDLMYASSDSWYVLVESTETASLWTVIFAVVVWPSAYALLRWRRLRIETKTRLRELGLYEDRKR